MNETLKILKERRSVRRYEARPVEREKLDAILEAGKYAPSAKGQQSVTMVVLTKREDIAELSALNAAVMGTSSDPFFGAPCVVVVLADPEATNAATQPRAKGASPPPIRAAHSAAARKKRTPISGSSRRRASVHCNPFPKARPSSAAHGGDLLAAHGSRPGRENPVGK